MISKNKLKIRLRKKTNPELAETIRLAVKNSDWSKIAQILSASTRQFSAVNLSRINEESKAGDTLVIPGKVLSKGNLTKKLKICALAISVQAKEKLKESKSDFVYLAQEIKTNPKAEGIKIIR
ncbi:MAG: 50S ribosomal protein L18e [Nanoarchaeota archaeon]|nr:50S ribosomal protein L18e [Nanoarchaeota archaeon]